MVRPAGTWEERRKRHLAAATRYRGSPGWKLKWWRLSQELTQAMAVKKLGCSQPSLAEFELNTRAPHDEIRAQIERVTGVRFP